MLFKVQQHESHSRNFYHNMTPYIRTSNFKEENKGIFNYCFTEMQGRSRLKPLSELDNRTSRFCMANVEDSMLNQVPLVSCSAFVYDDLSYLVFFGLIPVEICLDR